MTSQPRSLPDIMRELLPQQEAADIARRIEATISAAEFYQRIADLITFTVKLAVSNPRPWQEQKRGLGELAKRARKAASAVRELNEAFDDIRWVHTRQQLMDAVGWGAPDLPELAAELEKLALPAQVMAGKKPQNEIFQIFVQWAAPLFNQATGKRPTVTFSDLAEGYSGPFIEFVQAVWAKVLLIADDADLDIRGPRGNVAIGKATQRLMDKF
jgi:hypothetical protein